jgi:hypothetical protein
LTDPPLGLWEYREAGAVARTAVSWTSVVNRRLLYRPVDASVVSVSRKGIVEGLRVGKTEIRVIAHNGLVRNVPVEVFNYAYPGELKPTWGDPVANKVMMGFWGDVGQQAGDLVTRIIEERVTGPAKLFNDEQDGHLVVQGKVPESVAALAPAVLGGSWYPAVITISEDGIEFDIKGTGGGVLLTYRYNFVDPEEELVPAPHWLEDYYVGSS